jgi:hypothetical protein
VAAKTLLAQASVATRGEAMLEAGRALALDRTNSDAQALIAQLLLERPAEVPPEVDAAIEAARVEAGSVQLRTAVKTNLAYFLAAPLLLLTQVKAPSVLLVVAGLLMATAVVFDFGARRAKPVGRLMYLGLFLQCSLLAAVAILFSPFLVLPGLAAISVTAFAAHPTSNVPVAIVAIHILAIVAPIAAELLGILPHTFSISGATLSISPWAMVMPAFHLVWIVTLFAIAQIITAAMLVRQLRRAQESAQRDVYSYRWHLEQLVRELKLLVNPVASAFLDELFCDALAEHAKRSAHFFAAMRRRRDREPHGQRDRRRPEQRAGDRQHAAIVSEVQRNTGRQLEARAQ